MFRASSNTGVADRFGSEAPSVAKLDSPSEWLSSAAGVNSDSEARFSLWFDPSRMAPKLAVRQQQRNVITNGYLQSAFPFSGFCGLSSPISRKYVADRDERPRHRPTFRTPNV